MTTECITLSSDIWSPWHAIAFLGGGGVSRDLLMLSRIFVHGTKWLKYVIFSWFKFINGDSRDLAKDLDLPDLWPYGRLKGQKIENVALKNNALSSLRPMDELSRQHEQGSDLSLLLIKLAFQNLILMIWLMFMPDQLYFSCVVIFNKQYWEGKLLNVWHSPQLWQLYPWPSSL